MSRPRIQRPDADKLLSTLKDFQRDTVEYVFRRMYTDPKPTHRFLVADEVGLGKTLIARGVIAKALNRLWDHTPRIDVIYICSNADIARQNVARLNVLGDGRHETTIASRLTLLPTELKGLRQNKVNFVSFTPGTSFDLRSSVGRRDERVLLYWMLREPWGLRNSAAPRNVFTGYVDPQRFRTALEAFDSDSIDRDLRDQFAQAITSDRSKAGVPALRERFDELCTIIGRSTYQPTREEKELRNRFIADLRRLLARTCIQALEPDLIILDEFQRFKSLLDEADEGDAPLLARELFNYEGEHEKARVLLLSATPYKMYTAPDGPVDEDHYGDFVATLRFLQNDASRTTDVQALLGEFRRCLLRLDPGVSTRLLPLKAELESHLRSVMVRTERLALSPDRNGMLQERPCEVAGPDVEAIQDYRTLQQLARAIEHPDTMDYWKASPYLLNFMMKYKFKEDVRELLDEDDANALAILKRGSGVLAPPSALQGRAELQVPHSRVRWLLDEAVGSGLWKLLWLPPSLPYYDLAAPFDELADKGITKRLIFSAWRVVPRTLAALLSREAERLMLEGVAPEVEGLSELRETIAEPLKFSHSDGRYQGMSALGILYPSFVLASIADPLDPYYRRAGGRRPSLGSLLAQVRARIEPLLAPIVAERAKASGPADESWYWAAPILLDAARNGPLTLDWLARDDAARRWNGTADDVEPADDEEEAVEDATGWGEHVAHASRVVRGGKLGRPPSDLLDVLALQAVASPGVVALRSISRVTGGEGSQKADFARDAAGAIAWSLRNLFNLPDASTLVRRFAPDLPFWHAVLSYCAAGCLQAVLDEYQHVLPDFVGLVDAEPELKASRLREEVSRALGIRRSSVPIDDIRVDRGQATITRKSLAARFAMRFGDAEDEGGREVTRTGQIRSAFNSPFWPFVLATTTVGQEGLDFHQYCHAVVHWNLPSNPVDLEQREGRVHRFKGHAVRKNVAFKYGPALLANIDGGEDDPWAELFEMAREGRDPGCTDIVPFWVFAIPGGAQVERHVPALPLSRELDHLVALRRTLAVYRMVFGQPRQDELLDYLLRQMGEEEALALAEQLRIDLSPRVKPAC